MEFLFEKLEVYQKSLSLLDSLDAIVEGIKGRFPASRIDQLTRASLSIPLNIAEGTGRRGAAERGHFYVIARGSAYECAAMLHILRRKQLLEETKLISASEEIGTIVRMISGLIKHTEAKAGTRQASAEALP